MMAEVKWIKIVTDIFDDEKILLIESLPEADSIIVIWFKLLCLAGKQNNSGVFIMNNSIPYTDKMLATIFRRKESTVQLALKTFEQFGMVEILDGVITIPNWGKHQNLEQLEERRKYQREYHREYRKRQKTIATAEQENKNDDLRKCLRKDDVNALDIDKDKEEERDNNIISDSDESEPPPKKPKKEKQVRHKYGEYKNVLLSDDDMQKLQSEFPYDWQARIENLSSYMASTGKSYKNHLATIRNWARKDKDRQQVAPQTNYKPPQQPECEMHTLNGVLELYGSE